MDIDGDGGRREFGLRGQRRGTESIVAEMVERSERMGVIAWFCCRWEQPEARTHQKTARNNAFEQRTGLANRESIDITDREYVVKSSESLQGACGPPNGQIGAGKV
jgi:hypothetical protein